MKNVLVIGLLASVAWAADFSHMSTEEMMKMRGSVPVDDRPAFREEMQKRMQNMTPEERQKYMQTKGMGKTGKRNCCLLMQQPTFEEYDLNRDGKITPSELEEARAKRMGQKAKEGKMLRNAGKAPAFADMDKNNDGALNKEEFELHQMEQMKKWKKKCVGNCPSKGMGQGKGMMRNAATFAEIDTNNDGVISQEEFSVHQSQRMKNKGNCTSGNCP